MKISKSKNQPLLQRVGDIAPPEGASLTVHIDGEVGSAYAGETVLTTLLAHGKREISKNDHQQTAGAYCGMGICYCCTVLVDGKKRRACKTQVSEGMAITTCANTEDVVEAYLTPQSL